MTNFQQMHAALSQTETGVKEFLQLWAEQLPPERLAQLEDWLKKGLRLGLLYVTGAPAPQVCVMLIDAAGGFQTLERLDFATKH